MDGCMTVTTYVCVCVLQAIYSASNATANIFTNNSIVELGDAAPAIARVTGLQAIPSENFLSFYQSTLSGSPNSAFDVVGNVSSVTRIEVRMIRWFDG